VEIETLAVDNINPAAYNPRKDLKPGDPEYDKLKKSIIEFDMVEPLVWNKNQAQYGALSAQYKQKHEPCYYCFKKGATANWCGDTRQVTVWDLDRESKNEYHPTQKPVALAEIALVNHKAKTVLDLFGGSGSTLIACEKLDRRCYMMEIDEHYCDVIIKRWEDFTGKQAMRINDN